MSRKPTPTLSRIYSAIFICSLFGVVSCGHSNGAAVPQVTLKGSRVLGMDTNDAAADFTFNQSFAAAQAIGVSAATLHLVWSGDEGAGSGTTSGAFSDTFGALASANAFYPALTPSAKLSLTIAPIDTSGPFLPADLSGSALNAANVITRFNKFMDWVLSSLPSTTFVSIQIGNEIDVPSGASAVSYWTQYQAFLTAATTHLHAVKPGIKVGATVTLYGLLGEGSNGSTAKAGILGMLSVIDELGLTYYPLDSGFQVKDPSVVGTDISQALSLVGSKPVYFQEVGYPSSSACGSSNALQSAFVDQIFLAWDTYAGQIPFLSFLRFNDLSASNASTVAATYGLSGNAAFVAYLQTLGFRSFPATSAYKSSWTELQARTQERGW